MKYLHKQRQFYIKSYHYIDVKAKYWILIKTKHTIFKLKKKIILYKYTKYSDIFEGDTSSFANLKIKAHYWDCYKI